MPLEIVRNDITRIAADAIVNTANPEVAVGAGVDSAIYTAAGWDALLAERAAIGPMEPGEAAWTPAFALKAKYIIHTVGPVWEDGNHGEREAVASCYRNSLNLAKELGCETVAFPLISAGTYGFPKDLALTTAVSEISQFLFSNEMTVYMVVYDKEAFALSEKVYHDVQSFIDESEIVSGAEEFHRRVEYGAQAGGKNMMPPPMASAPMPEARRKERAQRSRIRDRFRKLIGKKKEESSYDYYQTVTQVPEAYPSYTMPPESEAASAQALMSMEDTMELDMSSESLEDILRNREDTFQEHLFRMIDRKGMDDVDVYKRANLDRKHFSKIKSNINYNPSKKTALALAVALGLNLDETRDLLGRAGIALTRSNTFDIIMEYCINHQIHDIYEINCILFQYDQPTLGA